MIWRLMAFGAPSTPDLIRYNSPALAEVAQDKATEASNYIGSNSGPIIWPRSVDKVESSKNLVILRVRDPIGGSTLGAEMRGGQDLFMSRNG